MMNADLRQRAKWGWREIPRQPVSLPYIPGMTDGALYRLKQVDLETDGRGASQQQAAVRRMARGRHAPAPFGDLRGDKWTPEQDAALAEAVAAGVSFPAMTAMFDRSEMSCRMRWRRLRKAVAR